MISEVARRYGLRPQPVFAWRREACQHAASVHQESPALRAGCGDASEPAPTRPAQPRKRKATRDGCNGLNSHLRRYGRVVLDHGIMPARAGDSRGLQPAGAGPGDGDLLPFPPLSRHAASSPRGRSQCQRSYQPKDATGFPKRLSSGITPRPGPVGSLMWPPSILTPFSGS